MHDDLGNIDESLQVMSHYNPPRENTPTRAALSQTKKKEAEQRNTDCGYSAEGNGSPLSSKCKTSRGPNLRLSYEHGNETTIPSFYPDWAE